MNYLLHLLILINIYIILALSLNLLVGYSGLLSLSHAAFYGVGGYVSVLLTSWAGLPFFGSLALAVGCAALLSLLISVPSLRLRGDYFVLASLGFQVIVFTVVYNWIEVTGGPYGISGIPSPKIFGMEIAGLFPYFVFSTVVAALCAWIIRRIVNSPFGRALKAVREDEVAAAALGKNIAKLRVTAFAVAAGFAAVAGVLLASYLRYIDPSSFNVAESIFILSIIIIGGTGNLLGPVVGTLLMILLPEALRFLNIPDSMAANLRQIIYGLLIVLLMRYRVQGLAGEYKFE